MLSRPCALLARVAALTRLSCLALFLSTRAPCRRTLSFVGYAASQGNDGSGGVEVWDVTPVAGADGEAMLLLSVGTRGGFPVFGRVWQKVPKRR